MPGPIITRTSLFPEWTKPENASVFDPAYRAPIRTIISWLGLDDPQQVMIGTPTEVPGDLGGLAGEVAKRFPRLVKAIKAYHGSPHDFPEFSMEKIGTGEGAQAYGHGLYFAEKEQIAKGYQTSLSNLSINEGPVNWTDPKHVALATLDNYGGDIPWASDQLYSSARHRTSTAAPDVALKASSILSDILRLPKSQRQAAIEALGTIRKGRMYEVNIHAEPEHFLDWDKPLNQQSAKVQEAIAPVVSKWSQILPKDPSTARMLDQSATGREFYQWVQSVSGRPEGATHVLHTAGVPGIKYFDASSRGAGEGTRNFVVFDDKTIEILRKYGILLPAAGAGAQALPSQPQQQQ